MTPRNGFLLGLGATLYWVPVAAYRVARSETARHFLFTKQPRLGQRERRIHARDQAWNITLPLRPVGPRHVQVGGGRRGTAGPVLSEAR